MKKNQTNSISELKNDNNEDNKLVDNSIDEGDQYGCWQCWPCYYENFRQEPQDNKYSGDIFGLLTMFESPHWLYRRFHKNFCKSLVIANLESYKISENEEDRLNEQIIEIQQLNYSIESIALHSAFVLMIGSVDTFLKDSFKYFLEYIHPEKIKDKTFEKIIRRYNFQNIDSLLKAYTWLFEDFKPMEILKIRSIDDFFIFEDIYDEIKEMLFNRHKIVHESYYSKDLTKGKFNYYSYLCIEWVNAFNYFFVDNGYYEQLDKKYELIFKMKKR